MMDIALEPLNYHHLRLFWAVAHEGNLTRASAKLGLTPQTVSSQIRMLEEALGEALFERIGRRLEITDVGQVALGFADEIFASGQEFLETLRGQTASGPISVVIGVASVLPKLIVHHLIAPALQLEQEVKVVCRQGDPEYLLSELSEHKLDLVLSDTPIPERANVRAYNHLLGECGITFMAQKCLAKKLRRGFPRTLDGAPILLPTTNARVRSALNAWFSSLGITPQIRGEFEDSGLLKAFGQATPCCFPVPLVVADEVAEQYQVERVASTNAVTEQFFAISVERRVRSPAVAAICEAARSDLFA